MKGLKALLVGSLLCFLLPVYGQNALDFDGTNDEVHCGTSSSLNITGYALTIEAWVYPRAIVGKLFDNSIVIKEQNSNNAGFMLRTGDTGKLSFGMGAGGAGWQELNTSTNVLDIGKWQHVVASYDGSKMRLYVDGVQVDSMSVSIAIGSSSSTPLTIGYHPTYGRYFTGRIDEVRVWSRTLSHAEIQAYASDEFCYTQNGLRAYYKFNRGTAGGNNSSVTTVPDNSGNNNIGNLSNFALSGSTSNWVNGANLNRDSVTHSDTLSHCGNYFDPIRSVLVKQSGLVVYNLQTNGGCDSILTRYYEIKPLSSSSFSAFACDSFIGPTGIVYRQSGVYSEKVPNAVGCDSTITMTLTIGVDTGHVDTTVCYTYLSPGGNTLNTSGTYYDILSSTMGCDSVVEIKLMVLGSTAHVMQLEYCDSVQSPSGKYWYKTMGTFYDTIPNSNGCDSILTIQTNGKTSFSTMTIAQCSPWQTPSGKVLIASGTYLDTIMNRRFCDSIITIHYTRNTKDSVGVFLFGCREVVSVNGVDVFTQSGMYTANFTNQYGCDSVVSMSVTVHHINDSIVNNGNQLEAITTGAAYQWLNCDQNLSPVSGAQSISFVPAVFGNYAVEITERGCKDTSECLFFRGTGIAPVKTYGLRLAYLDGYGNFRIHSDVPLKDVKVEVYDVNGRLVNTFNKEEMMEIDIHLDLIQGIYLLKLYHTEGEWNSLIQMH